MTALSLPQNLPDPVSGSSTSQTGVFAPSCQRAFPISAPDFAHRARSTTGRAIRRQKRDLVMSVRQNPDSDSGYVSAGLQNRANAEAVGGCYQVCTC
eukprot:3938846-Rhodomonas_salina.1